MSDHVLPAVVWDMGGIMFRYFTEVLLDRDDVRAAGIPMGPTGASEDRDYDRMNRGEIPEPEYLTLVRQRLADAHIDVDPVTAIHWPDQERRVTWDLIHTIHDAGHPQGLLTNDASKWLGDRWWEDWEPAPWFDAVIDVQQVGVRKPAPEPYLATAEELGLAPSDCLFVDDMEVNCEGAEAVGMASHQFDVRDPFGSIRRLAKRLELDVPAR